MSRTCGFQIGLVDPMIQWSWFELDLGLGHRIIVIIIFQVPGYSSQTLATHLVFNIYSDIDIFL